MGKAKRRTDVMDVIKKQQKLTKKSAGMKRQLAAGTAYAHKSAMAATKTLGGGAGPQQTHNSGDLNMHTYDIKDVDRLYFAVTKGSADSLENAATGIEAASYYDIDTDTQYTAGMNFQIPGSVTGLAYYFKIGSTQPFYVKLNAYGGADVTVSSTSNNDSKSCLRFENDGTPPSGSHFNGSIFYDGTDIKAQVAAGVVNLTSGGGGPTLGGTNTWTGANTFTTYPQLSSGSAANQTVDTDDGDDSVTFSGYFNIRDGGGTIRKVPYL